MLTKHITLRKQKQNTNYENFTVYNFQLSLNLPQVGVKKKIIKIFSGSRRNTRVGVKKKIIKIFSGSRRNS